MQAFVDTAQSHSPSPTLDTVLGTGRHGTVFRGTLPHTAETVAVKIGHRGERLFAEAEALTRLAHPHVVALHGVVPTGEIVIEHCGGGTLADALAQRALTTAEIARVISQVLAALNHIHELGWIHGDVTPGNIGLRSNGDAALFDLSLAQPASGATLKLGTPEYAGPVRTASPFLDLRAVAALLLEIVDSAGEAPHTRLSNVVARIDDFMGAGIDAVAPAATPDSQAAAALTAWAREQLAHAVEELAIAAPLAPPPIRRRGGTRDYGPRPGSGESDEHPPQTRRLPTIAVVVAALVVAATALGIEAFAGHRASPAPATAESQPSLNDVFEGLTTSLAATQTLENAGAEWDPSTGTLHIPQAAHGPGSPFPEGFTITEWKVGAPSDQAAIADWDCDGQATLGVYRASSGTWFEFATWQTGAASTVHTIGATGPTPPAPLSVMIDVNGCATPQVKTS